MTAEQIIQLLNVPGMIALIFIVVRQQAQIDKYQQATIDRADRSQDASAELIKQFMMLHPPQDKESKT